VLKGLLNLLLIFIVVALARRAIRSFFAPTQPQRPPESDVHDGTSKSSAKHPAIAEDEVIEDAEFEELD
jgi:hypothetical protein